MIAAVSARAALAKRHAPARHEGAVGQAMLRMCTNCHARMTMIGPITGRGQVIAAGIAAAPSQGTVANGVKASTANDSAVTNSATFA